MSYFNYQQYAKMVPKDELLNRAIENAAYAIVKFGVGEGASTQAKAYTHKEVKDALATIATVFIEESLPVAMREMVVKGASLLQAEVRDEMVSLAKAGDYALALREVLRTIKEEGDNLSPEQITEIVKSFSEYQKELTKLKLYETGYDAGYNAKEAEIYGWDEEDEE